MNRIKSKYFILFLISWSTLACNNTPEPVKNKDPFYVEDSGYDYIRFPLIKPYEVRSNDKGKIWFIQSNFKPKVASEITDAFGIKKINLINNEIIICYCEEIPNVGGKKYSKAWFIFIPVININKGFTNEEEFINYLQEQGIEKEQIQWKTPEELFKQFSDTYCLPWIPGC